MQFFVFGELPKVTQARKNLNRPPKSGAGSAKIPRLLGLLLRPFPPGDPKEARASVTSAWYSLENFVGNESEPQVFVVCHAWVSC